MADQLKSGGYYLFENIKVKRVFDRIEGNVGRPYEPNISKIGAESPSERLEEVKRYVQLNSGWIPINCFIDERSSISDIRMHPFCQLKKTVSQNHFIKGIIL